LCIGVFREGGEEEGAFLERGHREFAVKRNHGGGEFFKKKEGINDKA